MGADHSDDERRALFSLACFIVRDHNRQQLA
jgi:hypothetical protein